jgi:phage FluMu gp28-like protein
MLRKPDSIPAGDTVIADPVMEPFFISKSQSGGYTVYERVVKGEKDTEYIKTVAYPATFNSALRRVMNEKLNNGENKIYNLKEYISRFESIQKEMLSITSIDL